MAAHNDLGKVGEALAVGFLKKKGHEIILQNYRFEKAEIDIISKIAHTVVFTEVKTRSSAYFGYPEEAVSNAKQKLLAKAARAYLDENKIDNSIRFDIVAIVKTSVNKEIHHIEDAFFPIAD